MHGDAIRASLFQPSLRFQVGSMNQSALSFVVLSEPPFDPLDLRPPSSVAISHVCRFDGTTVKSWRAAESQQHDQSLIFMCRWTHHPHIKTCNDLAASPFKGFRRSRRLFISDDRRGSALRIQPVVYTHMHSAGQHTHSLIHHMMVSRVARLAASN